MTRTVLYFSLAGEDFYDLVRSRAGEGYRVLTMTDGDDAECMRLLPEADAIIVGGTRLPARYIDAASRLKVVLHQGVGYHDTVDTDALMRRQIRLAVTPDGTSEGVAEHTIMLMLAAGRRLAFQDAEMREGRWHSNTFRATARQIMGSTIGIVGLGRIGKELARRLVPFGARVIYTDILEMDPVVERELGVERVDLETLLSTSDFITLHVPLTDLTRAMIDREALAKVQPGAILINCARGPVVSETALVEALEEGRIGAAGLDVYEVEPPPETTVFARFPNVVLTPHNAPGTRDVMALKFQRIFENADRFFAGERMENEISLS